MKNTDKDAEISVAASAGPLSGNASASQDDTRYVKPFEITRQPPQLKKVHP